LALGVHGQGVIIKSKSNISFNDVAGMENAKNDLLEIISYMKNPRKFTQLGASIPKGILLMGPPGCGKTLLAKATAGEANIPFFSISGSEFIEMFVGVGASRVRDMFLNAKREAPSIIFIDEIDAIGRTRGAGLGGGHDEREQTLNQILSEMDGFETQQAVVVIAATNRPDVLDPALTRPGRFDRHITVEYPQKLAREKILKIHAKNVPLADEVSMENLSARTVGFSGADLRNLVNEAALLAGRKNKHHVEMEDFDDARDKILLGAQREEILTDNEKELVAYHESGHALVAKLIPNTDPLQKVTIIPRGMALGATEQVPEIDRHNYHRRYLLDLIAVRLGGRAAEEVVFNDVSNGAASDLKQVTQIARKMVCQWGMSERVGPVTFRLGEEHIFLGRELNQANDFSEYTAQIIDEEVRKIVTDAKQIAVDIIKNNRSKLDAIAKNLLISETLFNNDIDKILQDHTI
jgi:cell division protease FtsH